MLAPRVQPLWAAAQPALAPIASLATSYYQSAAAAAEPRLRAANAVLAALEPWQLVLATALLTLLAARLLRAAGRARRTLQDKGPAQLLSAFFLDLPGLRGLVAAQQEKIVAKIRADLAAKAGKDGGPPLLRVLPREGTPATEVGLLSCRCSLLPLSCCCAIAGPKLRSCSRRRAETAGRSDEGAAGAGTTASELRDATGPHQEPELTLLRGIQQEGAWAAGAATSTR